MYNEAIPSCVAVLTWYYWRPLIILSKTEVDIP